MPAKNIWKLWPVLSVIIGAMFAFSLITVFWDYRIAALELFAAIVIAAVTYFRFKKLYSDVYALLRRMSQNLDAADRESLSIFPLPAMVVGEKGEILWYNDRFRDGVLSGKDSFGSDLKSISNGIDLKDFQKSGGKADVKAKGRRYSVYGEKTREEFYVLYWIDDTELKNLAEEYRESRPAVAVVMIDNYDELMQNAKEGEKSEIISMVEKLLTGWVSATTGFLRHSDRDKYILVLEERHLRKMIENRFEILDRIRQIVSGDRMPATLSIGIGRGGKTLNENEEMARQALDMALGRGGDQAAVKTKNGYEFYGGVSKGVEKRTKVRTRIIASALTELIDGSDNVLIMGHRLSDLDVIGAATGLCKAVVSRGREAKIIVSKRNSLALSLIEKMETQGYANTFVEPEEALQMVMRKTLLIIVDTHRQNMVEFPELYKAVKTVVVIDHHRKMVDFIDNAVIFYHEPFASSTSEMVSELLQYIADQSVSHVEAGALLAGITLDTRNFTVRTGVRTFEAAAYLRRKGADTAHVRLLFSGSMESYRKRSQIVSSSQVYKKCAIAVSNGELDDDMRVVAPQAADELLSIAGVNASFVLYPSQDGISVSARSMGDVNVQLIMETLGGGGHQTMAGAQIKGKNTDEAKEMVIAAIDKYLEQNK